MGKDQKARSMINLIALELNKDEDRFFEDGSIFHFNTRYKLSRDQM